jgi:hypothetical protein
MDGRVTTGENEPASDELLQSLPHRGPYALEVMNWQVAEHDGAQIFERIVLRHALPDGSFRYHVYRVVGRATVAMYDVFELPAGYRRGPIAQEDLKSVWPPRRDYNREG